MASILPRPQCVNSFEADDIIQNGGWDPIKYRGTFNMKNILLDNVYAWFQKCHVNFF